MGMLPMHWFVPQRAWARGPCYEINIFTMITETPDNKIQIGLEDLHTRKVDQRLKEQEALARNRRQAEMNPVAAANDVAGGSLFYHPVFIMVVAGLIGGLLAWGGGEALRFRPDPRAQAQQQMAAIGELTQRAASGQMSSTEVNLAINELRREYDNNPYFAVYSDTSLSESRRKAALAKVQDQQALKDFITNGLSFGLSGLLIALCLAVAEPLVDHNIRQVMISGTIAAAVGLIGGVAAALVAQPLYTALEQGLSNGQVVLWQQIVAHSLTWGILGMFLTIAPGLVMRNGRKLGIGLFGGLLGGLVGGALFDPVSMWSGGNVHLSRGIALVAIGIVAGGCTGLIENAAKTGWLKVTAGLIAGKQFILYRNPTFIGSGPECQIYLFRDAKVGRRHAALHLVPGGIELENLPLGATTLVNGKPVDRVRLHNGDKLQVGATGFVFQEKAA